MPKPNRDRHRINVDLGWPVMWLLRELLLADEVVKVLGMNASTSNLIRYALDKLAQEALPAKVLARQPYGEPMKGIQRP